MILRWMPWRFVATRMARAYGFLDPIQFLSRLRGFAQPSEVSEPVELLRAGVLFHARGLINTKTIQHNLDWVWPYWVERQFNPADESFIPRAFSFSHINLTHRNWTAVGLPDIPFYPIVDPRGLVTPIYDGWSLDFWLIQKQRQLFPSKLDRFDQRLLADGTLRVRSRCYDQDWKLETNVSVELVNHHPHCIIDVRPVAPNGAELVVALRPYNPEGVSYIDSIELTDDRSRWIVNKTDSVLFGRAPLRCVFANYKEGDVRHSLADTAAENRVQCKVGLATGAALFNAAELTQNPLRLQIPIRDELQRAHEPTYRSVPGWRDETAVFSRLQVPDERFQEWYDLAVYNLVLHSPGEVYPGPYTYKRFWYRDAAFIINALITLGARDRARRALDKFPSGQIHNGYFRSQAGEWDSNGEALWIMHRYLQLTGMQIPDAWRDSIFRGARWIVRKRLPRDLDAPHAGLLPAGFSAEHLGPNDYYYWDDFWGVAGLRSAADLLRFADPDAAKAFTAEADEFLETIVASFRRIPDRLERGAISASPHRRLDAGAIGSLVADFPLQLFPPGEERLLKTVEYLLAHSFFENGFFQNMIHSGINAYLTLHVAQVMLRAGDARAGGLIDAVAGLATSTGQWPEAIHPRTKGGCMGDGQHIWAAAEWAVMIRNLFVREEGPKLIIGSGLFPRWLETRKPLSFGPTLTPFGAVTIQLQPQGAKDFMLHIVGQWFSKPPELDIRVPGHTAAPTEDHSSMLLQPSA